MNNEKGKINTNIIIFIFILIIIILLAYIIFDKLNEDKKMAKDSSVKITSNNDLNDSTKVENKDSYELISFTSKELVYELGNKKITFSQAIKNDVNSGVEFTFSDDVNTFGNIDTNGFYNLESIGEVKSNNQTFIIFLVSNENGEKAAYLTTNLSQYESNSSTNNTTITNELLNGFVKINTDGNILSIGSAKNKNEYYPYINIDSANYIISSDGTLEKRI